MKKRKIKSESEKVTVINRKENIRETFRKELGILVNVPESARHNQ